MAEILRLRKADDVSGVLDGIAEEAAVAKRSIEQAQRLVASRVDDVFSLLDGELARIATLIEVVPEPDVALFLSEECTRLSAAVCEAELKLESYKGRR